MSAAQAWLEGLSDEDLQAELTFSLAASREGGWTPLLRREIAGRAAPVVTPQAQNEETQ